VTGVQTGSVSNVSATESSTSGFNPVATQPVGPFNDPVTTPGYFAPPAVNTSVIGGNSVSGSTNAPTTGLGTLP
jgi:hypothetical protein